MELVFPNLCKLKEFREYIDQTFKVHRFERMNKHEIENSPFQHYESLKKQLHEKNRDRTERYRKRLNLEHCKKIIERPEEK